MHGIGALRFRYKYQNLKLLQYVNLSRITLIDQDNAEENRLTVAVQRT